MNLYLNQLDSKYTFNIRMLPVNFCATEEKIIYEKQ